MGKIIEIEERKRATAQQQGIAHAANHGSIEK